MTKYIALLILMLLIAAGNTWTQCDYIHDHYDYDGLLDFIWCPVLDADGYNVYVCQKPAGDASYTDDDFKFIGKTNEPHIAFFGSPLIWYRVKIQDTKDGRVGLMSDSSEWVEIILKSWIALNEPKPGLKMELYTAPFFFYLP